MDRTRRPGSPLVLDLAGLAFLDGSGLRALLRLHTTGPAQGDRVYLAAVRKMPARVADHRCVGGLAHPSERGSGHRGDVEGSRRPRRGAVVKRRAMTRRRPCPLIVVSAGHTVMQDAQDRARLHLHHRAGARPGHGIGPTCL
ncbi:STAS domain-containing protein [Nonomuraea sp. H19]|uniref:STAS domain-containing protein n=1 Tax=Nonomuraea sp. H19 TaxID=3452206 RepID=UPI003F8905E1